MLSPTSLALRYWKRFIAKSDGDAKHYLNDIHQVSFRTHMIMVYRLPRCNTDCQITGRDCDSDRSNGRLSGMVKQKKITELVDVAYPSD